MKTTVLAAKLFIPQPRTRTVRRARLIERMNEGLDRKLTLISASAGFGKTSLVCDWVAGCGRPVAWLSLDEGDNDIARFLTYLAAALRTAAADHIGESVVRMLDSQQPPLPESILTVLLNEISALPYKIVLVLDDYHAIHTQRVDEALAFLLEHLPQQMHLVIATRQNPQLPLGRLRARGDLTELRAADLRFTSEEAAEFFNQAMGLGLTAAQIDALELRTEGWVAGLQLAALSMQGREDVAAFIRAFAGDNRYVVDYLVEEVLQRQSGPVREFLLRTSILDRLHGPLCDAVTGQQEGSLQLEALERGNFFIVPLDDSRRWYRYHHLFAEVLSIHLRSEYPDQAAALHRRASDWYERHGFAQDAIRHALAAGDVERAAELIELAWADMRRNRQESEALGWLKALPDELIRLRPVLSVEYAWALLAVGELAAVEGRLRAAEQWLDTPADLRGMVVADQEEFRRLPGTIAGYRAALAQVVGDIPAATAYARQVLDLVPEDDHLRRGAAAALLGLASWVGGELEAAHRMFAEGMVNVRLAGNIADAVGGAVALAQIRIAQGRLRQAMGAYEQGLQLAEEQGEPVLRGTADMYVGMSEICFEQGDMRAAAEHLLRSQELGEHAGLPQYRYRWRVAMAQIREAEGDTGGALDLLHEAEQLYVRDFFPNVRPAAALKVRLWAAQGRLNDALEWIREQGLSVEDDLSYLREFEYITLAKVLLVRYENERENRLLLEAAGLLNRLLQAAEEGGRAGSAIEIMVMLTTARYYQGDTPGALALLRKLLALAEPEGYFRIFADGGRPMAVLLEEAAAQGIAPKYARRLLMLFGSTEGRPPAKQALREPLSERERDVLRLLRTELSGPDIARELIVSLNTLRTHTKNIYDKLEVNNRRAAVRRAEELGLL